MSYILSSILLGITLAAPVGPISVEIVKRGLSFGFWSALLVGIGGMSADLVFMLLIYLGLHPFLQLELVQTIMYALGSSVFFFLAIQAFISQNHTDLNSTQHHSRQHVHQKSFRIGFFIALLNPINIVFWFAVYGTVLTEQLQFPFIHIFLSSIAIFFGIFLWNINIAFLTHFLKRIVNETFLKYVQILAGCSFVYFSLHFFFKAITSIN